MDKRKISSNAFEIETSIKLLEHLKRKNVVDDGMYNYVVSRLIKKQVL